MMGVCSLAGMCAATQAILGGGCSPSPTDTAYGNPNTLDRKSLPGEGGAEPLNCGGGEGGAPITGADGGCPTYATDIFPLIVGPWKCSDATCHGGPQIPLINGTDPAKSLADLRIINVLGKGYISAGDAGGEGSLLCNLQGSCGSPMPKPPLGKIPTSPELCLVQAWLKCGAK